MSFPIPGPRAGFEMPTREVHLTAHASITKGYVYALSTLVVDTDTDLLDTTKASAGAPSLGSGGEINLVALEDIDSGAVGKFAYEGIMDVFCEATNLDVGDYLIADNAQAGLIVPDVDEAKIIGVCLADTTGASPDWLVRCMFSGLHGFATSTGI